MSKRNHCKHNRSAHKTINLQVDSGNSLRNQTEGISANNVSCADVMDEPTYVRERALLVEIEQKSADQHDKAILTIASGGLALSVTFLRDIAPHPLPDTWKYLGVSWVCFVIGILVILLSFQTSQSACRKQREFLDALYQEGSASKVEKNRWSFWTNWLNWASYVLVFFAVVFFTLFSWLNLVKGDQKIMAAKPLHQQIQSKMNPIEVKGGAVPPKAPVVSVMERQSVPPKSSGNNNK